VEEQNCFLLSDVTMCHTLKLEIQAATKPSTQVDASWFLMGNPSTHLVDQSMIVKM
jgi:hypothetical protein